MTPVLERATTVFSPEEDRIRITGATQQGQQVVIWMTRHLLGLLLPVLFDRLDKQFASVSLEYRQTMQEFAQQTASSSLGGSAPVITAHGDEVMLCTSVDVGQAEAGVILIFRDQGSLAFALPLSSDALRQWLHILYLAEQKADWRLRQWPEWMSIAADPDLDLPIH